MKMNHLTFPTDIMPHDKCATRGYSESHEIHLNKQNCKEHNLKSRRILTSKEIRGSSQNTESFRHYCLQTGTYLV